MNRNIDNKHIFLTLEEFIRKADIASENTSTAKSCEESFLNIEIKDISIANKLIIRADLSFSRITGTTFSGINFEGTEFNFTELENVVFFHCKLHRSSFDYAKMKNVKFVECHLDSSSFDFAAGEACFSQCKVHMLELHHTLAELHFSECAGEGIEFNYCPDLKLFAENCDFHRALFNDSNISGKLSCCCLSESDFSNSVCTDLNFVNCQMRELNISGSSGVVSGEDSDDNDFDFDFE